MFRRRGSNVALPTTSTGHRTHHTNLPLSAKSISLGDAKSIRLYGDKSLRQVWAASQTATKISWILTLLFVLTTYWGIRSLRYYYSQISLTCHMADCSISITPVGWKRKASVTIPRRQLAAALAVKTTYNGTYVSSHPPLNEYSNSRHNKKNPARTYTTPSATYKGPDGSGHYVSYALILKDPAGESIVEDEPTNDQDAPPKLVDLSPIRDNLQRAVAMDVDENDKESWLLTFHLFGISHTKRRVRTMVTRIDSYVKSRRHTVTVKESGNPSWVGILCVVFGLLGFFLTLLLGQYVDEKPMPISRGPGVMRHHRHSHSGAKSTRPQNESSLKPRASSIAYARQRATPARFEVRMQPTTVNSQKQY